MELNLQTHLFAVHSASVAAIKRQSEESIAVAIDPEAGTAN